MRHLGRQAYTEAQVAAWAGFADDTRGFSAWLDASEVRVAVGPDDVPLGFVGFTLPDRVCALFVAPAAMRRGLASRLLEYALRQLEAAGARTVRTEASEFSRPLFERFGFEVLDIERTRLAGVDFTRYAMQRPAAGAPPGGRLRDLRGLGPRSEDQLRGIGIRTRAELDRVGPVRAWLRLQEQGHRPSLNLLYALVGALQDRDWREVARAERDRLLAEIDGERRSRALFAADGQTGPR